MDKVDIKVSVSGLDVQVTIDDEKSFGYPDWLTDEDDQDGVIEAIKDVLFNDGDESHFNG